MCFLYVHSLKLPNSPKPVPGGNNTPSNRRVFRGSTWPETYVQTRWRVFSCASFIPLPQPLNAVSQLRHHFVNHQAIGVPFPSAKRATFRIIRHSCLFQTLVIPTIQRRRELRTGPHLALREVQSPTRIRCRGLGLGGQEAGAHRFPGGERGPAARCLSLLLPPRANCSRPWQPVGYKHPAVQSKHYEFPFTT